MSQYQWLARNWTERCHPYPWHLQKTDLISSCTSLSVQVDSKWILPINPNDTKTFFFLQGIGIAPLLLNNYSYFYNKTCKIILCKCVHTYVHMTTHNIEWFQKCDTIIIFRSSGLLVVKCDKCVMYIGQEFWIKSAYNIK